jgi:hypothetical protein
MYQNWYAFIMVILAEYLCFRRSKDATPVSSVTNFEDLTESDNKRKEKRIEIVKEKAKFDAACKSKDEAENTLDAMETKE